MGPTFLYLHALAPTSCDAFGSCVVLLESPLLALFNFSSEPLKPWSKTLEAFLFAPIRLLPSRFCISASGQPRPLRHGLSPFVLHIYMRGACLMALSGPTIMLQQNLAITNLDTAIFASEAPKIEGPKALGLLKLLSAKI